MKILVTGGAGFIGSYIVDRLIKEGYKVAVIDNLSTGKRENLNTKAKFYKVDIKSSKVLDIFKKEKPKTVFHLAAQIDVRKSVADPIYDAEINIFGSLNIIQNFLLINREAKNLKSCKFIFSSTGGAIYGDAEIVPTPETYPEFPLSPYGICKLTIEKYLNYYCKIYGLPFTSLRYANVYGPRQNSKGEAGVIAIFLDKMFAKKQLKINGKGRQTRDFVYVDDVVEANILAMRSEKTGIYNIGTAKETNINAIFKELKRLANSKCKRIYSPALKGEQKRSCLDFKKARKEIGWNPKINLEKGLKLTADWFEK